MCTAFYILYHAPGCSSFRVALQVSATTTTRLKSTASTLPPWPAATTTTSEGTTSITTVTSEETLQRQGFSLKRFFQSPSLGPGKLRVSSLHGPLCFPEGLRSPPSETRRARSVFLGARQWQESQDRSRATGASESSGKCGRPCNRLQQGFNGASLGYIEVACMGKKIVGQNGERLKGTKS